MSKELIERLREAAGYTASPSGALSMLLHEAADALEAKAAPVGEREAFEAIAAGDNFGILRVMSNELADQFGLERGDYMELAARHAWRWFQAGAAYHRAQQPQSAEAVAYTTAGMLAIAKELPLTGRIGARCKADDRWNVPLYTTPQPSAAVAMPELPPFAQKVISKLQRFQECAEDGEDTDIGRHWLDLLTQLALLNRVQRSPALWEISQQGDDVLARLNGKEVGRG